MGNSAYITSPSEPARGPSPSASHRATTRWAGLRAENADLFYRDGLLPWCTRAHWNPGRINSEDQRNRATSLADENQTST